MDDMRERISRLTLKLQSQSYLPLWALTNENVIYSYAMGKKSSWGPKTRILLFLMTISYKLKISDLLLFCVGLYRALSIWWKVKKNQFKKQKLNNPKRIFAGFGATCEESIYADYIRRSQEPSGRVNWVTAEGISEFGCPSLISILNALIRNTFGHSAKLRYAIPEISLNTIDFLMVCALNVGVYSFYRPYWLGAKIQGINEVTFLAPDIIALACIDEGIKSIFLQHGLMALSIIIPKFNRIDVLTSDEERYLLASRKGVEILKINTEIRADNAKNNILMLLSPNVYLKDNLMVQKLVQWAIKIGLEVVIRPAPNVTKNQLAVLKTRFFQSSFDDHNVLLNVSLEKWNPKLVVSWRSTALVTALEYGCLPISLCDPLANDVTYAMIYPLKNRVLFWPRDEALIEDSVQSQHIYHLQLNNLRNYSDDGLLASMQDGTRNRQSEMLVL